MNTQADQLLHDRYQIIESDIGPLISESRCTVFDVMELHNAGESLYAISEILNLTPLQVETALAYIVRHEAVLAPQLAGILQRRVELEEHYRGIADGIYTKISHEPITQRQAEFLALREHSTATYKVAGDAGRVE